MIEELQTVEFFTLDGDKIAIIILTKKRSRPIHTGDITHARLVTT